MSFHSIILNRNVTDGFTIELSQMQCLFS